LIVRIKDKPAEFKSSPQIENLEGAELKEALDQHVKEFLFNLCKRAINGATLSETIVHTRKYIEKVTNFFLSAVKGERSFPIQLVWQLSCFQIVARLPLDD